MKTELEILRAAMWQIVATPANSNSDPDLMGCELDRIVRIALQALKDAQDAQDKQEIGTNG